MTQLTALLSVSDKTGIVEFARSLHALGIKLLSTGGTAKLLAEHKLPVTEVSEITGFPEMLDGRVKTLHPRVHGGLLARRDVPEHMAALKEHGINTIDLLVINLYPFAKATAKADCTLEDAIENIDIGGPAMLRAAAKNWQDVGVVIEPSDYPQVLSELKAGGPNPQLQRATKFMLAKKVFAHTAAYDGMITNYLTALEPGSEEHGLEVPQRAEYPEVFSLQLHKVQGMRYGENPHQSAAFYREAQPVAGTLSQWTQIQGKELSYNNIADADAAWECVKAFEQPACVIVKHANPCGVAVGATLLEAYQKALKTDPTSAFGGIMAFNRPLDADVVEAINANKQFVEVALAPAITPAARAAYASKTNVRLLEVPLSKLSNALEFKRVGGGMLLQSADTVDIVGDVKVVTQLQPTAQQMQDMLFAWTVARFVKSNAIVFCKDGMTMGVGAGQMSRLDSARIASIKAQAANLSLEGTAVASDAFFPFRDGLDVVVDAGASCVIHPGGSMRDDEVIAAANERGIAMVLTGTRHFRH
ncbi:MAG: bifunctional phosphoribosylaminoimidazolecarboxamide formyltransferase/IMP cyclohydrolase [Vitreoscilla sp.]|nr:bifunctional phosphoribosylaminoimidazolecarboxamide formyltransferase/IMP cyclohydrolase [Vitreoscilla sp.]MBP6675104.1 bifunctional phosphoribosylaminoimidazolecarboxamide formyltransferase/IMP cyclohydrolase [Vitreoscilla sp.]